MIAGSTYIVCLMFKKALRGREKHQKKRDGRRSNKKTVAEDPMDNDKEWQEEEVRVG
jgi:hypothetical protein